MNFCFSEIVDIELNCLRDSWNHHHSILERQIVDVQVDCMLDCYFILTCFALLCFTLLYFLLYVSSLLSHFLPQLHSILSTYIRKAINNNINIYTNNRIVLVPFVIYPHSTSVGIALLGRLLLAHLQWCLAACRCSYAAPLRASIIPHTMM